MKKKDLGRSLLHISKQIRAREAYKAGRKYTDRKREIFAKHLEDDYFDDKAFRRRFRMEKSSF